VQPVEAIVPQQAVEAAIRVIRGQKVILDFDIAELYGVETRIVNRAVTRNLERFPADFMFELTKDEDERLKSQIGISKGRGGRRRSLPRAFTEEGVAMLSSVLRSSRAVQVNIEIMRAFVRLRHILSEHRELAQRLDELESKYEGQFTVVFKALRELMQPPAQPGRRIGFSAAEKAGNDKQQVG
jgi:hypothetical protein